jgi:hypothetical protein
MKRSLRDLNLKLRSYVNKLKKTTNHKYYIAFRHDGRFAAR